MPREFVIPGETRASAALEVARSVMRRAERRIVALAATDGSRRLAARLTSIGWPISCGSSPAPPSRPSTSHRPNFAARRTIRRDMRLRTLRLLVFGLSLVALVVLGCGDIGISGTTPTPPSGIKGTVILGSDLPGERRSRLVQSGSRGVPDAVRGADGRARRREQGRGPHRVGQPTAPSRSTSRPATTWSRRLQPIRIRLRSPCP